MTDYLLPKETGIKRKRSFEKVSILTEELNNKSLKFFDCLLKLQFTLLNVPLTPVLFVNL